MPTLEQEQLEFANLSPDVTGAFSESGVVCLRGMITNDWRQLLAEWVEIALANPGDRGGGRVGDTYAVVPQLWNRFDGFRRFAFESPIAKIGAFVMGSQTARMYNDAIFVKERSSPEPTPWHQDLPYFRMNGNLNCSAWIPLDAADASTGAMSYALGSHHWGKLFDPVEFGRGGGQSVSHEDEFAGPVPNIDADPERFPTVTFTLEPGDIVFHHLRTLHKSGANTSADRRRRVHTVRFAGDDAVWINRPYSPVDFDVDLVDGDLLRGAPFPLLWPH